jgi:hypothetical protein
MGNARALVVICAVGAGCSVPARTPIPPGLRSPYTGYASALYRDDRMWLCRPDLPGSACRADLTATEIGADGARTIVPYVAATDPPVDCFYVYPTVDLRLLPGNHTDLADRGAIVDTTLAQAARFGEVCNLYVPLYRQITIGTYAFGGHKAQRLDVAFSDVEDAFLHYMGQYNHGHKIVLIGHSQGADMVMRLLRSRFDHDPILRARLLVALAIGGPVEVVNRTTREASLANIPVCSSPDQVGCVVGYHSYRATDEPVRDWPWNDPRGQSSACVNPAAVGSAGWHAFSRSYFATHGDHARYLAHLDGITTPFVLVRGFYGGACASDDGHTYLRVAPSGAPGDRRQGLVDLGAWALNTGFGLHPLDVELAQGDLIELVRRAARATGVTAPGRAPPAACAAPCARGAPGS